MLSNTSKRRGPLIAELPGRGFRSEWLHDAICSGECCWEALRDSGYASAVVLGWSDRDSSEYLEGTGVALGRRIAGRRGRLRTGHYRYGRP